MQPTPAARRALTAALADPHARRRLVRLAERAARGKAFAVRHGPHIGRVRVGRRVGVNAHHAGTSLRIASGVRLFDDVHFYLEADDAEIVVGAGTYINRRTEVLAAQSVRIGSGCAISWDVVILDTDYHSVGADAVVAPVVIGDRVWIGCGALILKGVTIGEGAVVGAGSLVTSDVPARTLVVGRPAKVVRHDVEWR